MQKNELLSSTIATPSKPTQILESKTSELKNTNVLTELFIPSKENCKDYYNGLGIRNHTTSSFEKNGDGVYIYNKDKKNESKYIGKWREDKKNGEGIMLYSNGDIAIGNFENGELHRRAAYFWYKTGYKGLSLRCETNFYQAFFGQMIEGNFFNGFLYSNREANPDDPNEIPKYIYFGGLTKIGKKYDDKGILYDLTRNCFYYGQIRDDQVSGEGYEILFDKDYQLLNSIKVKFNISGKISEIQYKSALDNQDEINFVEKKAIWFINKVIKDDVLINYFNKLIKDNEKIFGSDQCLVESKMEIIGKSLVDFKAFFRKTYSVYQEKSLSNIDDNFEIQ